MKKVSFAFSLLLPLVLLFGCVSTPAYDQTEYDRVIRLKVDSLELLSHATNDFSMYANDVKAIKREMAILYEYAKNLPNNEESIQQIEIMNDENGALLGKALKDWEDKGKLGDVYLNGLKVNISDGFNQISGLISKRIKK